MEETTELEISGSDAGFEEDGVGGEVRGEVRARHEIKGGDCFLQMAEIGMADETGLE